MFVFPILLAISLLVFGLIMDNMDNKESEFVKSEKEDDKHEYRIFSEKDFEAYMTWCITQGFPPGTIIENPEGTYTVIFD